MTKTTTKEYGNPKRQRRQSAYEEDDNKEGIKQGGPALSEAGDGDDDEGGDELR